MKRYAIKQLLEWKNNPNKKPLIIEGARQVGKTWLMQEFGKNEYRQVAYINFENNLQMKMVFDMDLDPKRIIQDIGLNTNLTINPKDTLIIFDEIQECPRALTSLKYFNETAPEYSIIAAGSMLGVTLHKGTSFPVGKVDFMTLYPMSFVEFLEAIGEERFIPFMEKLDFQTISVFKDVIVRLLKHYFYIGGMPEAVQDFVINKDFIRVKDIQNKILKSYEMDFSKHIDSNLVEKIKLLWNSIPAQLSKENKKFIYGAIKKGARANDFELAIAWLRDCGLIYQVHRVNKPIDPLKFYEDFSAFKIFILDIGLFCNLSNVSSSLLIENKKIFEEFNGALTEQYVLQQLKTKEKNIFYWSTDTSRSEIDFMIQSEENVIPIEVKSTINLQAKSLKFFREKFKPKISVRTSLADYKKTDDLYDIPLYMIEFIDKIIK
ncbi:MAG: ATP-binding protein [Elusimicrobia bacterium]|nr:ATP-binding protein [Elusimicrobiota bacterium]